MVFFVFRIYIILYHFFAGNYFKTVIKTRNSRGKWDVKWLSFFFAARVPFCFVQGSFSKKERLEIVTRCIIIPRAFLQNNGQMGRLTSALPKKTDA